jgi:hypothetical protein
MYLLNLTLGQFLVIFGSLSALTLALYLLDRSRRRQTVATLRFWVAAQQPSAVARRRRIQQPWSLLLQLVSIALLLLAIAQLRLGTQAGAPRDHIVVLDTSSWMAARAGNQSLMDLARERARAYVRAVPAGDRIMIVRADALATPATAFEPDRRKLEQAIAASQPGATALNLEQALSFARRVQSQPGRRSGEVVFVGTGRIAEREPPGLSDMRNLRVLPIRDPVENCGLRRVGLRRSAADPDRWEVFVSVRNYGSAPRAVTLALSYGAGGEGPGRTPVGTRRLTVAPGTDGEATFAHRTAAAGALTVELLPRDHFPADDRVVFEVPQRHSLAVTVYSAEPELLRPLLAAHPQVRAVFRSPAEYRPDSGPGLVILDRFRPPTPPSADCIWIDPPAQGSPIPAKARATGVRFTRWHADHALGAGLRTRDFRLDSASVFVAGPDDIRIGEVESGPVIVARPGKPRTVVFGFHPAHSALRYELATPLLFANILHWVAPEIFRRWELSGASLGNVKTTLDSDLQPSDVRVVRDDGTSVPFTLRGRALDFFVGEPGTVRVLAGDNEYVHSLTLPQLWESRWEPPESARRGIPRLSRAGGGSLDVWQWLALLGGAGLLAEWILYGRFRRGGARLRMAAAALKKAS